MAYAAVALSVSGFGFAVASFWWLHARRGHIEAPRPGAYAFVSTPAAGRLRLPFAFFNTGARSLVVADLRLQVEGGPLLHWETTRSQLRPAKGDGHAFAVPFAIPGRATREMILEFKSDGWKPEPNTRHVLRLSARQNDREWSEIAAFDWWSPPADAETQFFIAHRNEPDAGRTEIDEAAKLLPPGDPES